MCERRPEPAPSRAPRLKRLRPPPEASYGDVARFFEGQPRGRPARDAVVRESTWFLLFARATGAECPRGFFRAVCAKLSLRALRTPPLLNHAGLRHENPAMYVYTERERLEKWEPRSRALVMVRERRLAQLVGAAEPEPAE